MRLEKGRQVLETAKRVHGRKEMNFAMERLKSHVREFGRHV